MPTNGTPPPPGGVERPNGWLPDLVRGRYAELTPAERSVADFLVRHPEQVVFMSAAQLAGATGTSDATVIRTARSLGFSGLPELKHAVGGSLLKVVTPAERVVQRLRSVESDSEAVVSTVFSEVRERLDEHQRRLDVQQFDAAVDAITRADDVWTFGVGVSATAAQYLSIKLNRAGVDAYAARTMGFSFADDVLRLRAGSVAVLFSPGRVFREVEVALAHVAELGGTSILVADSLSAQGEQTADIVLSAPLSMSGTTGEVLSELVVCDALVLGAARRRSEAAASAAERLNAVRSRLGDARHARARRRADEPGEP